MGIVCVELLRLNEKELNGATIVDRKTVVEVIERYRPLTECFKFTALKFISEVGYTILN